CPSGRGCPMPAPFRPSWSLLGLYAALLAGLLLVAGPLSQVYFSSPLIGWRAPDAVPAAGGELGWDQSPAGLGLVGEARLRLAGWLSSSLLQPDTLKSVLQAALPGRPAVGAGGGRSWVPLSPAHVLRRAFETAGGIQLGRPWTLLASELPAMHLVEMPEDAGPLAVDVLAVLPQWRYEALLAAGRGDLPEE